MKILLHDITCFIDNRERHDHDFFLLKSEGVKIFHDNLPLGDYVISNGEKTVYVELKRDVDILASMYDNRLSTQLTKLSAKEFSILAFVGHMYDTKMAAYLPGNLQNIRTLVSIATSIALKKGENRVGFVQYDSMEQFELGLLYISKKLFNDLVKGKNELLYNEDLIGIKSNTKINSNSEEDLIKKLKISTIMRIPRIGYKTSLDLLNHFDFNMKKILYEADQKEITSIKGVGKKTFEWIEKIYR